MIAGSCCTRTAAFAVSPAAAASREADPFPMASAAPPEVTDTMVSSELDQVTAWLIALPYWSRTVALKVRVCPR